ncbi:MAG: hypothetical protein Q9216_002920 [Gyalolechia sp. 2 TL-2023]
MKSSLNSVKGDEPVEVWCHPPVSRFGAKQGQRAGTSCATLPIIQIEQLYDIQTPQQRKERPLESGVEATSTSTERGRTGPELRNIVLRDLRAKLGIDLSDGTCLATTTKHKRCKNHIAKKNLKAAETILEKVETGDWARNSKHSSKLLKNVAELLHCARSHQPHAPVLFEKWEVILGLRTESMSVEEPAVPLKDVYVPQKSRSTDTTTQDIRFDTSKACIRSFVPYDARAQAMTKMDNFVEGAITAKLGKQEIEKAGHIYIYWFPGNFGHLKIGLTSRPIEKRLREWERKCGHAVHLDFVTSQVNQKQIPHVHRVEKIVQARLRDRRKKEIRCTGCGTCHKEWFEVFKEEAIEEVLTWSAWMRSNPYEELAKGDWRLKKSQKAKVKTLCRSVPSENQKRCVSTSQLKEKEERNRRLSASPHSHRRTGSEKPPRRSKRLAAQLGKSSTGSENSNVNIEWTLKLEP